jgi:Bacterial aa3 type cytochrome c oxidase subunit IV
MALRRRSCRPEGCDTDDIFGAAAQAALLAAAADQRLREMERASLPDARNYAKSVAYCAWRDAMDDHDQLEYATARGNDYVGHEQMYRTFVTLTRNAVVVIAVILILMAIFLT